MTLQTKKRVRIRRINLIFPTNIPLFASIYPIIVANSPTENHYYEMKVHFIAIGGSVMNGLALALAKNGHTITGSDDHIYDPARTKLSQAGLLPDADGWFPERITSDLDAVILGMHAFEDNPELLRAKELGLPVYSFPEFIFEQSRNKQRVVIAGSYGKSTVTAMVMHVLEGLGKKFDYLIGAPVPGFEASVRVSDDAPVILIEGDEYLSSRIDKRSKFLLYHPHICLLNGMAWDHINVFPTEEIYIQQFETLVKQLGKAADVIVNADDERLHALVKEYADEDTHYLHPFHAPSYKVKDGQFHVKIGGERVGVSVFGKHNMSNMAAAWEVCQLLAVTAEDFRRLISTFTGAGIRLETVVDQPGKVVIRDYAHAPEKVAASVQATREKYSKSSFAACFELHTFSSLNPAFLPRYKKALDKADFPIVFVDSAVWERKRMEPFTEETVKSAFGNKKLEFIQSKEALLNRLSELNPEVTLMMSSGNFSGVEFEKL